MVVSGADQLEIGGSAVGGTSISTGAGTSKIGVSAGLPENRELVAEIPMIAVANGSGWRSPVKVQVIVIAAGASELHAPAEASDDRTVLAEVLIFGARVDAPGWVSAVEVPVVAVGVTSEIPVAADVWEFGHSSRKCSS